MVLTQIYLLLKSMFKFAQFLRKGISIVIIAPFLFEKFRQRVAISYFESWF